MLLAIAALLMQPQAVLPTSFSAEKAALIQPAIPAASADAAFDTTNLPSEPLPAGVAVAAAAEVDSIAGASTPEPAPMTLAPTLAPITPGPMIAPVKPGKSGTISISELMEEQRHKEHEWIALSIAAHSAAAFDAWSTRHAITTYGAQELDPLYKPFANNGSIYAVIQVGPAIMDYVAKRMMYSRNNFVRRMWWVPQTASMVSSVASGGHNLTVR